MVSFEKINNDRISFGYITHQFKSYKKHCNKMKKIYKNTDKDMHLSYSLETNMAKFKMLDAVQYLYKNLRLLNKAESTNENIIYKSYIECFIENKKKNTEIDKIVSLRHELADFYSFLDDIYVLADNRHNFEQYKTKYQWNDIKLVFETPKILESFLNGTFPFRDFRFNTQLALKILDVRKNMENVKSDIKTAAIAFTNAKQLYTSIEALERFLNDNFVESLFVVNLKKDVDHLLVYLKSILDYTNGNISINLDNFVFPNTFKDVVHDLKELYNNRKIDLAKMSSILLKIVEDRLRVDDKPRKMPFLPVFYDIAYDFIEYPKIDPFVVKKVKGLDFTDKK